MEINKNYIYIIIFCFLIYKNFKKEKMSNTNIDNLYDKLIEDIRIITSTTKELSSTGKITINGNLDLLDDCYLNSLPKGAIVAWNSDKIPKGWALCEMRELDLRGRFIYGEKDGLKMGQKGGEKNHKLSINEIPSHTHSYTVNSKGGHSHSSSYYIPNKGVSIKTGKHRMGCGTCRWGTEPGLDAGSNNSVKNIKNTALKWHGAHKHTISLDNAGGNKSHNNMPPYYVINWIVKI